MNKLILKSGVSHKQKDSYQPPKGEIDLKKWLYEQLKDFHLNPSDDCCEIYQPIINKTEVFSELDSGNLIILENTPLLNEIFIVFRNGRYQVLDIDYTITNKSIIFNNNFGHSTGAVGKEEVVVIYKYK